MRRTTLSLSMTIRMGFPIVITKCGQEPTSFCKAIEKSQLVRPDPLS